MNRFGWGVLAMLVGGFSLALCSGESRMFGGDEPSVTGLELAPTYAVGVPVEGVRVAELTDSWNDPRDGGDRAHQAIDIAAPRGTPVVAAFAGTVIKLFKSNAGGITAYVRNADWQAYYAHLDGYAPGLAEGQRVAAGQPIGFVGDTGNAGAGNTHLHFALHRMGPRDRWWEGTPVNPYPLLARKPSAR